jgi:hypothetical protein
MNGDMGITSGGEDRSDVACSVALVVRVAPFLHAGLSADDLLGSRQMA